MRPRSRLLSKRGLPTIREGSEELVHDLNQTNSQHSSAQDYFHSICQLAQPTFPLHEPDRDILSIGMLDSPKPCIRPYRLRQLVQPLTCPNNPSTTQSVKQETAGPAFSEPAQVQSSEQNCPKTTDPLEYLYGYRGTMVSSSCTISIPCTDPSAPHKSNCSELCQSEPAPLSAVPQRSPLSKKKLDGAKLDATPCRLKATNNHCMDKQKIVSHWIAECRSAWREARLHACMLPAIAEK